MSEPTKIERDPKSPVTYEEYLKLQRDFRQTVEGILENVNDVRVETQSLKAATTAAGATAGNAMRIVQQQSQMIGNLTQEVRGRGSTEPDPEA